MTSKSATKMDKFWIWCAIAWPPVLAISILIGWFVIGPLIYGG